MGILSIPWARSVPLYLAVYVVFFASASCLYSIMDSGVALAVSMVLVGSCLLLGFFFRRFPHRRGIGILIGTALSILAVTNSAMGDLERTPLGARQAFYFPCIVAALAAGACTEDTVLFLLVPCMGMMISGGAQSNDDVIVGFVLTFCLVSLFALLYHAALRTSSRVPSQSTGRSRHSAVQSPRSTIAESQPQESVQRLMLIHGTLACLIFMTTALVAMPLAIPAQMGGGYARPFFAGTGLMLYALRSRASGRLPMLSGMITTGNSVQVGMGPTQLVPDPILRVRSDESRSVLSRIYTEYTNSGWKDLPSRLRAAALLGSRGPVGRIHVQPNTYSIRWRSTRQNIALLVGSDVLPTFEQLEDLQARGRNVIPYADTHGCVRLRSGAAMVTYDAASRIPPDLFGPLPPPVDGPTPPIPDPPLVPAEVSRLAADLDGKSAIETTGNIVKYIQSHCTYDLNAPAVPRDRDAVDFFLFQSRAGYCDLFATSAALLLQLDGIPARYCIGYLPGEWSERHHAQIVTAAQAHAWVEVFIPQQGWLPIDPTPPGFAGPPSTSVWLRDLLRRAHISTLAPDFPLVVVGAALLLAVILIRSSRPSAITKRIARQLDLTGPAEDLAARYWRMQQLLAGAGLPRLPSETPFEYVRRVARSGVPGDVVEGIKILTGDFVRLRYSGVGDYDSDVAKRHEAALTALRNILRKRDVRNLVRRNVIEQRSNE